MQDYPTIEAAVIYHFERQVCIVTDATHEQIMAQMNLERLKAIKAGVPNADIGMHKFSGWHFNTEVHKAQDNLRIVDFSLHPVYAHLEPHNR